MLTGAQTATYGYSNDLLQEGGDDLLYAITKLTTNIKEKQKFPQCLQTRNITSLYIKKGSVKDLNNFSGFLRTPIFRKVLDKLIFNDVYELLDENFTDSNVGGRKRRNIRDNIFVINAKMNSVRKGNEQACDITIYDTEKCFYALLVQEYMDTLYED